VCDLEQRAARRACKADLRFLLVVANRGEIEMEDPRCKIAAVKAGNSDSYNLLDGVTVGIEDPRCSSLPLGITAAIEDARYMRQELRMEDPRCMSMLGRW
jgi:hypothetical protein